MAQPASPPRWAERVAALYGAVLLVLAAASSVPAIGEWLFHGYFVQDADEVIRAWYGRCAWSNPNIIPYSHLSMPGWTAILAATEGLGMALGLPLTFVGRMVTVLAAWTCLRQTAAFIRTTGGDERTALLAVTVLAASPGFFLMSLTVYPEVALLALALWALNAFANGHFRRVGLLIGVAPLIRWEGALLWALFAVALTVRAIERRPKALAGLGLLALPYGSYLLVTAIRWGNPWTPLAWRTTKFMGAWRLFNPDVPWPRLRDGLANLITFYSPVVLLGALPLGLVALRRHRPLVLATLAFGGLDTLMLSVQHDFMVYPLRVFVVPLGLGVALTAAVAGRSSPRWRNLVLAMLTLGTAYTVGAAYGKIQDARLPRPGESRDEIGFHAFVRQADASAALEWLMTAEVDDWLIVNHQNANLLRADATCRLYERPLWIGGPRLALSRAFEPAFGLPPGGGLVVFHLLPFAPAGCTEVARFDESHQVVYRCVSDRPPLPAP